MLILSLFITSSMKVFFGFKTSWEFNIVLSERFKICLHSCMSSAVHDLWGKDPKEVVVVGGHFNSVKSKFDILQTLLGVFKSRLSRRLIVVLFYTKILFISAVVHKVFPLLFANSVITFVC